MRTLAIRMQHCEEIIAKSILVKSKLPDTDYVLNPYVGCSFGCTYCYASFMGRFADKAITDWGNYVSVKINSVDLISRELGRWTAERKRSSILMSSVTDAYQPVEGKYKLARGMLQELAKDEYPGKLSILTKSPLVLRDIEILKELPQCEVGFTVTTTDDNLSRTLECRAPAPSSRLRALHRLAKEGIATYAFIGPLLPHFRYEADLLDDLFRQLSESGVKSVFVEHLNIKKYIQLRLLDSVKDEPSYELYKQAEYEEHRQALDVLVHKLLSKYGLRLRMAHVLYHHE